MWFGRVINLGHLYAVLCSTQHVVHWELRISSEGKRKTFCFYSILWIKKAYIKYFTIERSLSEVPCGVILHFCIAIALLHLRLS